jgi:methyl-accepting chemotaxis protein
MATALVGVTALWYTGVRQGSKIDVEEKLNAIVAEYTTRIESKIVGQLKFAQAVAAISETETTSGSPDRATLLSSVSKLLAKDTSVQSVAIMFEPNAFDGKDQWYKDMDGMTADGRFIARVQREGDKIVVATAGMGKEDGIQQLYYVPLSTGKNWIVPPFRTAKDKKTEFVSAAAVPIMGPKGRAIGVASVEVNLETMQGLINELKPLESGYSTLISDAETWIANPDAALSGQPVADKTILKTLQKMEQDLNKQSWNAQNTHDSQFYLAVKIPFLGTKNYWTLITSANHSAMFATANAGLFWGATFSALAVLFSLALIWLIARRMASPINAITGVMSDLAAGKHIADVPFSDRENELGSMARAVGVFKENADKRNALEQEAASQRIETEKTRASLDAERQSRYAEINAKHKCNQIFCVSWDQALKSCRMVM